MRRPWPSTSGSLPIGRRVLAVEYPSRDPRSDPRQPATGSPAAGRQRRPPPARRGSHAAGQRGHGAHMPHHSGIDIQIVANIALRLFRLLNRAGPRAGDGHRPRDEAARRGGRRSRRLAGPTTPGMSIHRTDHEQYSLFRARPTGSPGCSRASTTQPELTVVILEALHAVIGKHRRRGDPITMESGIVRVSDEQYVTEPGTAGKKKKKTRPSLTRPSSAPISWREARPGSTSTRSTSHPQPGRSWPRCGPRTPGRARARPFENRAHAPATPVERRLSRLGRGPEGWFLDVTHTVRFQTDTCTGATRWVRDSLRPSSRHAPGKPGGGMQASPPTCEHRPPCRCSSRHAAAQRAGSLSSTGGRLSELLQVAQIAERLGQAPVEHHAGRHLRVEHLRHELVGRPRALRQGGAQTLHPLAHRAPVGGGSARGRRGRGGRVRPARAARPARRRRRDC